MGKSAWALVITVFFVNLLLAHSVSAHPTSTPLPTESPVITPTPDLPVETEIPIPTIETIAPTGTFLPTRIPPIPTEPPPVEVISPPIVSTSVPTYLPPTPIVFTGQQEISGRDDCTGLLAIVSVDPWPAEFSTLSGISLHYYGTYTYYRLLSQYNNILDPDLIYPGQIIKVPILDSSGNPVGPNPACSGPTLPPPTPRPLPQCSSYNRQDPGNQQPEYPNHLYWQLHKNADYAWGIQSPDQTDWDYWHHSIGLANLAGGFIPRASRNFLRFLEPRSNPDINLAYFDYFPLDDKEVSDFLTSAAPDFIRRSMTYEWRMRVVPLIEAAIIKRITLPVFPIGFRIFGDDSWQWSPEVSGDNDYRYGYGRPYWSYYVLIVPCVTDYGIETVDVFSKFYVFTSWIANPCGDCFPLGLPLVCESPLHRLHQSGLARHYLMSGSIWMDWPYK